MAETPPPEDPTVVERLDPASFALTLKADSGDAAVRVDDAASLGAQEDLAERYALTRRLGAGGMGEVLLARDNRVGREVALKTLLPDLAQEPSARARFVREARIQGQLEHPAVVPVYDLGEDQNGRTWFTMKRVRGMTLDEIVRWLASGEPDMVARFSRRRLLTAFGNVCLAMDFAHARGVIHRDLKPANLMLGDFGEVHILDWGVARVVAAEEFRFARGGPVDPGANGVKTQAGAMVGSPGYMSPEQVRGEPADARSDVYALGAILFELLTLAPLHPEDTVERLVVATLQGADARISSRTPSSRVAPELEAICVRATALDPGDRYPTARALGEAVERFLDGDRDLELRRSLARKHADRAVEALETRPEDPDGEREARAEALREVTRALALNPEEERATVALGRMLAEPPKVVPPEVERDLEALRNERVAEAGFSSILGLAAWIPFVPLVFWMGIRDVRPLALVTLFLVSAGALLGWALHYRVMDQRYGFISFGLVSLGLTGLAAIFGPLVLVPPLVLVNCAFFALHARNTFHRRVVLGLGLAAVLAPLALSFLGVVPAPYHFEAGRIYISPGATHFTPLPTMLFLTLSTVLSVVIPVVFMVRYRSLLDAAERRLLVQSWHFQHLVPDDARSAAAASSAPPLAPPTGCEFQEKIRALAADHKTSA
ncbi:MAG: protein kinase [Deltaproteobacteria bacterium]|nr:protein kinase [Deltaproteobacteria bacterium]